MILTGSDHTLDATTPVFDQSQFLEYPADHAVAQFGDAFLDVVNGKSKGQQARIFDLKTIVEKGDADGGARLRVVGMHNRIHDSFAHRYKRKRPEIGSLHGADDSLASHVLSQESNHFRGGSR